MDRVAYEKYKKVYYTRDDYASLEAFFEKEIPDEKIDVISCSEKSFLVWDRRDSNRNLERYGFSHYFFPLLYNDYHAIPDGYVLDGNTVSITTDDGEPGILFRIPIRVGSKNLALVFIRQSVIIEKDLVRIVSCRPTMNENHLNVFWDKAFETKPNCKPRFSILNSSYYTKEKEILEKARKISKKIIKKLKRQGIHESIKAYKFFVKKIKAKDAESIIKSFI